MKTIILYNAMMFASPRHLMNHFRKHDVDVDININYLTQCVYKGVENPKGIRLKYRHWDIENNEQLKLIIDTFHHQVIIHHENYFEIY